ncbi:MAG: hypothetical protein ACYC6Y_19920 [Thermoguttaceae bacterium]
MWLHSLAQLLTLVATGAEPAVAMGQGMGGVPDPIPTRQTYFAIPFEIDQVDDPVIGAAEVQLYVSRDRGATWQHETSVAPNGRQFLFRASSDGEYWFAVRTRDRAGNFRPPLVTSPGLRVLIDTQAPTLTIDAQRGEAGQIVARWTIEEANVKAESFKLQSRIAGSQLWETIAVDPSRFQSNGTTSSGEATWWPPAGQGRVEIRVEVSDRAGNPNVSHAQVTTVVSGLPPDGGLSQSSPNPLSLAPTQPGWQMPAAQNSWSQSGSAAGQLPPAQQLPSYGPYGSGSGGGPSAFAGSPEGNSGYGANPDPNSYLGAGIVGAYASDRGLAGPAAGPSPTEQGMTAANPNSSFSGSAPAGQEWQAGSYSQNAQPAGQSAQAFNDGRASNVASSGEDYPAWGGASAGYGHRTRPGVGTVAAQPSPPYQSQYNPAADPTLSGQRQPVAGYPSGGGSATDPSRGGSMATGRIVNTKLFEIAYSNPTQPMAVGRVELWGTRDGGVTWQSFGYDSDSRSPMLARVADEGNYGFKVVFHPLYGPPVQSPRQGDRPDMIIRVDLTRPDARLIGVDRSPDAPNQLSIRWQAADSQLANTPISLFYADAATGDWRLIAQGLQNSGEYRWNLPIGLPPEVQIRVEACDMAGNRTSAETRNPVRLAGSTPAATGAPPYSVEIQDVRPVGQTGQATPRRYYIR